MGFPAAPQDTPLKDTLSKDESDLGASVPEASRESPVLEVPHQPTRRSELRRLQQLEVGASGLHKELHRSASQPLLLPCTSAAGSSPRALSRSAGVAPTSVKSVPSSKGELLEQQLMVFCSRFELRRRGLVCS